MRQIDRILWEGNALVGTCHIPESVSFRGTGFLFLNFGYVPRDGHGGLAAKLADALAAEGFYSFRFDLPGLGDSSGRSPAFAEDLFDSVTSGAFAECALAIARDCMRRFPLKRMVLGGLCGAAVTSIYAADRDPETVGGLVLLEPELFLTTKSAVEKLRAEKNSAPPSLLERSVDRLSAIPAVAPLFSYWGWMRLLTLENKYGQYVPLPRTFLLSILLRKDRLPDVTNIPLVDAWERVVARRVPSLVITAQGKLREVFFDRINGVALSGLSAEGLQHVRLSGTNHIFTSGGAIEAVRGHVLPWALSHFAELCVSHPK